MPISEQGVKMKKLIISMLATLALLGCAQQNMVASSNKYEEITTIRIFKNNEGVTVQRNQNRTSVFEPINDIISGSITKMDASPSDKFNTEWELQMLSGKATKALTKTLWLSGNELSDGKSSTKLSNETTLRLHKLLNNRFDNAERYSRELLSRKNLDGHKEEWLYTEIEKFNSM